MTVHVRRLHPNEGAPLRDIRLRALSDSPSAFSSTYQREAAYSPAMWEEAAARRATGDHEATFVAVEATEWLGLVGVYRPGDPGTAELVSMWTAPEARGRGIGTALVEAVIAWARAAGVRDVQLWVTRGNEPAIRLYEGMGFCSTGEHKALPSDPCRDELRMALAVVDN